MQTGAVASSPSWSERGWREKPLAVGRWPSLPLHATKRSLGGRGRAGHERQRAPALSAPGKVGRAGGGGGGADLWWPTSHLSSLRRRASPWPLEGCVETGARAAVDCLACVEGAAGNAASGICRQRGREAVTATTGAAGSPCACRRIAGSLCARGRHAHPGPASDPRPRALPGGRHAWPAPRPDPLRPR